ncbi:MAG: carboxypeptidase regulatory-like domain-containing protein, partial [Bacteroidia bacterium]
MKQITSLFAILYVFHFGLYAQNITGKVTDEKGQGISLANVVLLQAKDSALIEAQITENNGVFSFQKVNGASYFLAISALDYKEIYSPVFEHTATNDTKLTDFQLKGNETTLSTVEIVAKKPIIEVQADKTIFNVSGSINAINTNALDLLRKSPGVMVDNNDNIILKGKNGTRIYIDGKPSPLDG